MIVVFMENRGARPPVARRIREERYPSQLPAILAALALLGVARVSPPSPPSLGLPSRRCCACWVARECQPLFATSASRDMFHPPTRSRNGHRGEGGGGGFSYTSRRIGGEDIGGRLCSERQLGGSTRSYVLDGHDGDITTIRRGAESGDLGGLAQSQVMQTRWEWTAGGRGIGSGFDDVGGWDLGYKHGMDNQGCPGGELMDGSTLSPRHRITRGGGQNRQTGFAKWQETSGGLGVRVGIRARLTAWFGVTRQEIRIGRGPRTRIGALLCVSEGAGGDGVAFGTSGWFPGRIWEEGRPGIGIWDTGRVRPRSGLSSVTLDSPTPSHSSLIPPGIGSSYTPSHSSLALHRSPLACSTVLVPPTPPHLSSPHRRSRISSAIELISTAPLPSSRPPRRPHLSYSIAPISPTPSHSSLPPRTFLS